MHMTVAALEARLTTAKSRNGEFQSHPDQRTRVACGTHVGCLDDAQPRLAQAAARKRMKATSSRATACRGARLDMRSL